MPNVTQKKWSYQINPKNGDIIISTDDVEGDYITTLESGSPMEAETSPRECLANEICESHNARFNKEPEKKEGAKPEQPRNWETLADHDIARRLEGKDKGPAISGAIECLVRAMMDQDDEEIRFARRYLNAAIQMVPPLNDEPKEVWGHDIKPDGIDFWIKTSETKDVRSKSLLKEWIEMSTGQMGLQERQDARENLVTKTKAFLGDRVEPT